MAMNVYVDRGEVSRSVRDWIERGKIVGEEIRCIVLVHDESRDPVDTFPREQIPKSLEESEAIDVLVGKIADKLEGDAKGHKGSEEQYYVECYTGTNQRSSSRLPCLVAIDETERRGRKLKPNEEGVLALAIKIADNSQNRLEKQIDKADTRYDASLKREELLRLENANLRVKMDEMISAREKEKIEAADRAETRAMVRELFLDAKAAVPTLINRLAGENVLPVSELGPEQLLLRELVRQLDTDEMRYMIEMIAAKKPRIGIMIAELVLKVQGEDVRRKGIRDFAQKTIEEGKKEIAKLEGKEVKKIEATYTEPPKINGTTAPHQLEQGRNGAPLSRGEFR